MDIKDPSVNEWELQAFFGSVHVSRDFGDQWYDSDSLYEYQDSTGLKLTFAIHPIHLDVRVTLSLNENIFYDWQVCGALDVHYIEEVTQSRLVVEAGENEKCEILISPTITLKHFSGSFGT
tara:strand:- start:282 stop:644 length:363 start_codon:yes stop_codon:yes gene_type:complete